MSHVSKRSTGWLRRHREAVARAATARSRAGAVVDQEKAEVCQILAMSVVAYRELKFFD